MISLVDLGVFVVPRVVQCGGVAEAREGQAHVGGGLPPLVRDRRATHGLLQVRPPLSSISELALKINNISLRLLALRVG